MDVSSSTKHRFKFFGMVVAATTLVALGVVSLSGNGDRDQLIPLDRAQAMVQAEFENVPMAQLPDEASLVTPKGWKVETDEPLDGPDSETEDEDEEPIVVSNNEDDEIDLPVSVERDAEGNFYIADALDDEVIVKEDKEEEGADGNEASMVNVGEDTRTCYKKLKKCGTYRKCNRRCSRSCRAKKVTACKHKKFCRCYCKFKGNKRLGRKCVIYKRKICKPVRRVFCKRLCKKFCKNLRRCYCCPRRHIRRKCVKKCKTMYYGSKCGNCKCARRRCYLACRFLCKGTGSSRRAGYCYQPKKVGPCKARKPRYYFNKATKKCQLFYYGGCAANSNNFKTLRQCKRVCRA